MTTAAARSLQLEIEPEIRDLVRVGWVRAEPVRVQPASPPLLEAISQTCAELCAAHAGKEPAEIDGLKPARRLYRAFGIDPTRTRPSSEALLRRILRDKPFPRVNNAVDLCNLAALRFLRSLGLYDVAKLAGPVTLRRGRPGEAYQGIRKEEVHLDGRPTLVDALGPFGNPTSDSLRASVDEQSSSLWLVLFASNDEPAGLLEEQVEWLRRQMTLHLSPVEKAAATWGQTIG